MDTFLPMIRQPSVWVNPHSYPGNYIGDADFEAINKMGLLRKALTTRTYPTDNINIHTQAASGDGPVAEAYLEAATGNVPESEYEFSAAELFEMKMITSSSYVPQNKQADYRDGEYTPDEFVRACIVSAVSMEIERQLLVGDTASHALEINGLATTTGTSLIPRQQVDAAGAGTARARLRKVSRAASLIRSGNGSAMADMLICAPVAAEQLQLDVGEHYGEVEEAYIPGSSQETFYVPTPFGKLLVVPTSWAPQNPTIDPTTATLYVAHTRGPMGLHIAVPEGSPDIEICPFSCDDGTCKLTIAWDAFKAPKSNWTIVPDPANTQVEEVKDKDTGKPTGKWVVQARCKLVIKPIDVFVSLTCACL